MFTKSPNNNTWVDRGSPKQALLKKKARSTILSVLSKRQTQERNFIGKNQTERQSWSSDSTLSDPDTPKPSPTKVNERSSPTYERSPRTPNEAIPVKPGYHYSRPSELSQKSPRQYSERSTSQSSGTPEFSRIGRSPIVSPVSREFSPKPTRTVFEFQPQITRQPSFEERKPLHSPVSPTSSFSEASPNTPPKTAPKPARSSPKPAAEFRSPLESGSNFVIKPAPGEPPPKPDKPYSVVIQSTARYPPPKPRRSSADVTPYTVTVNSVRVFEATPKMVEADPKLYSKWERYPSRDLPVMSPSFKEQFDWEISRKGKSQEPSSPRALGLTGIPVSDGDTTPRGIPLPARRISVSSDNEPEEPPKLISDSVQVSIPFGIRDVPKSSRDEGSWASRVSVCVPFQVFQGEAVKVSPEAQEALDNAQYSQLKAIAESEDRAAHNPMRVSTTFPRNVQQIISPTEQSVIETAKGQWGPVRELARGQRFAELNAPTVPSAGVQAMNIPSDAIDGPHLVSVGGQQMAQEVHIPMRVNEQMVQGMPDASRDVQDGAAIGKHGKYSVSERARKGSDERHKSSVGRVSERTDQEKRTKATPDGARGDRRGVGAAARPTHHTTAERPQVKSRTVKAVSTKDVLGKPTGDELAMLKARIRQLEGERDSLQEKLDIMEKRISSGASVEKDNIRLQVQLNDATKDLEKTRKKLDEANEASKKAISEKSVLQSRHNTLLVEMEKLQISVERTEDEKTVLQGEKNNLINKNKRLQKEIDASLEDADRLSEENTNLVAENKRLRNRLNDLLHGLRDVKRSVVRVKEENGLLHDEIVSNGAEMMAIMKKCFGGLEMVVSQMDKQETTGNKHGGGIPSNDRLDNENQKLREELADRVDQNEILLKQVKELEKVRDEQMDDLEDQYKEIEHLKEINEELNNRNVELSKADNVSFSRTDEEVEGCPGCAKLRLELNALQEEYESQKIKIEELEVRIEDLKEENDDYQQETKYLKQVLSYREDMKSVQVSQKATRQLQKLESNLEDAEKKCKDLEDEVSKLYSQKQTLLMNILKQHEEEVEGQDNAGDEDGEEEDDENEEDENEEDASEEEQPNVTSSFSFRTPKSRGGTIFGKRSYSMESEFSSGGTSFYDSSSDEENDAPSELNNAPQKLKDYVYVLQDDLKHFKSSFKETRAEKKSMERRLENSSEDFKAMLQRMQKLDKENVQIRDKMRKEKKTYKSQVKSFEQRIEELKENLQETEEEKQALIRCMQMNGGGPELETPVKKEPESPIPMDDMSRLIAKAQEFARQEQASRGKVSDKSSSEESEDNDVEEGEEEPPMKESAGEEQVSDKGSSSGSSSSSEDEEDGRPPVNNEMNRSWMQPEPKAPVSVLKNRMAHIQETRASPEDESTKDVIKEDEEEEESDDDIIVKPPPHARFLQRKASIASINMDRVSREKQHLEDEVASLSKYLNRSISRRRHSTVEMPKTPPLGAMKTLQSLLQKSDAELKESNAKIARLQEINADFEERFKDSETLQDDLRKAVVIANNFAMEEREKNNVLEEEKEELLKQLEALKKENARLKGRKSKGKNFKSRITGDEDLADSDNGDQGLEFCSSRHSSIASITSNVSRGSLDSGGRQDSNSNLCSSTVNGD